VSVRRANTPAWTFWGFSAQAKRTLAPSQRANETEAGPLLLLRAKSRGLYEISYPESTASTDPRERLAVSSNHCLPLRSSRARRQLNSTHGSCLLRLRSQSHRTDLRISAMLSANSSREKAELHLKIGLHPAQFRSISRSRGRELAQNSVVNSILEQSRASRYSTTTFGLRSQRRNRSQASIIWGEE
jgi:hypothetical protein